MAFSVKYEEVYLNDYASPREARTGLTRYFNFYNFERPHQTLNYQTPAQVYVSRFLGNFSYKTTQMFRDINFKVFKKLLFKRKQTSITIDMDSSVINVEGHQEGTAKGYKSKKVWQPVLQHPVCFLR